MLLRFLLGLLPNRYIIHSMYDKVAIQKFDPILGLEWDLDCF